MEIEWWPATTLPSSLCDEGFRFIRRRFKDEWDITRTDVTRTSIKNRDNIVLLDDGAVVGWLGIEKEGEFTNACIERFLPGTHLLGSLIVAALELLPLGSYFAFVPVARTGSARAFISCGFRLGDEPVMRRLSYPEADIEVVRLMRESHDPITRGFAEIHAELGSIRRLKNGPTDQNRRPVK